MFQLEALAAYVLYEAPTIRKRALYLEQGTPAQDAKQRLDRGEKRRESQKQRIRQIKGDGDQRESTVRVMMGSRARTRSYEALRSAKKPVATLVTRKREQGSLSPFSSPVTLRLIFLDRQRRDFTAI
jgi:hypothetical protein